MKATGTRRKSGRKWWLITIAGVVIISSVVVSMGRPWVAAKFESVAKSKLAERGLRLERESASWTAWGGLKMNDARLSYADGRPLLGVDQLRVRVPFLQFIRPGDRVSYWSVKNGNVSLYDAAGEIRLAAVSLDLEARKGELKIQSAKVRNKGLAIDIAGKIATKIRKPGEPAPPFHMEFQAVRGVLAALDVREETGPFHVTGEFEIDASKSPPAWHADLAGKGNDFEWKGVPVKQGGAEAKLTQDSSTIHARLEQAKGRADFTITRSDWKDSPFAFSGNLVDAARKSDEFTGRYEGAAKRVVIERLHGPADLWSIAEGVPAIAAKLPAKIGMKKFPDLDLKGLIREISDGDSKWTVESVAAKNATVVYQGKAPLNVDRISGEASYTSGKWRLQEVQGDVFSGRFTLAGTYRDSGFRSARVKVSRMKLSEIKEWNDPGESDSSKGLLSIDYRGEIDIAAKKFDGEGSMRLDDAPVFDVPLLEQTYDLFAALVPGIERSKEGQFDANFTAGNSLVDVSRFEASGGSLTVTAKGTINLKTERVDGSARGKLSGLPGLVTSPLSRLLEMNVGGSFDDIRVKPLGPAKLASNAASGTVGVAVDTIEESGKIAGTVLTEGVKLPFRFLKKDRRSQDKEPKGSRR